MSDKTSGRKRGSAISFSKLVKNKGLIDFWRRYQETRFFRDKEKIKISASSRWFGRRLFKVYELIDRAKIWYLIREGKAAYQAYLPGSFKWVWKPEDYDRVPFSEIRRDIREYVKRKPASYPPIKHLRIYIRRAQDPKFLSFIQNLLADAPAESRDRFSSEEMRQTRYAFEVAGFIYSRPEQRALRRDILRRFTSFGKEDLDKIAPMLQLLDISSRPLNWKKKPRAKERKQIIYYRMPFDRG